MRKVAIALIVIVVLGVLATPLLGGLLAQRVHAELVKNLAQVEASTQGAVRVTDQGYELGWLSSKARMRVEIGGDGASWSFPLVHVIHHGPLPLAYAARGLSAAAIDTTIEDAPLIDGKVPFVGATLVGITGDVGVDLTSLALPPRAELAWEGGTAQLQVAGQGKQIKLRADAPRFEMHGTSGDFVVEGLKIDYAAQRAESGPNTGAATYSLGRARVATPATQRSVAIDGLSWSSKAALNESGKLDSGFALRLAGLDLDDQSFRDAAFELALRNLDESAVKALSNLGSEFSRISASGLPPDALARSLQQTFLVQLPAFLTSSPEIEVKDAHVETREGRIDAALRVKRDSAASGAGSLLVEGRVVLPLELFGALALRAAGEISPTARQNNDTQMLRVIADQIAQQVLTRGYFREEEDGRLASDFSYTKQQLVLNGQPLNMAELVMAAGALPQ